MNKSNILTIGLDTHKEFFEVAYEEDGWDKQLFTMAGYPVVKHQW